MWRYATVIFGAAFVASPIVIEVLRWSVHRRRERRDGLGGSQDVAMWGTLAGLACLGLAVVCGTMWWLSS